MLNTNGELLNEIISDMSGSSTNSLTSLDTLIEPFQKAVTAHNFLFLTMMTESKISRRGYNSEEKNEIFTGEDTDAKPKSIFTKPEKYMIVALGGLSGFWSSISSPIYVTSLSQIQSAFGVTQSQVNITIVVYSIFQGVGPMLFSSMADTVGRRPIVLACLLIYTITNCVLAVNSNFAGLVILRCVQAFGISSTISLGSGMASDITTRAERASFIGLTTGLALLGQAFGAFVGGMISSAFGWRAIFWFLAIAAGSTFIVVFFLLPETASAIVGPLSSWKPRKWRFVSVAPIMRTPLFYKRLTEPPLEMKCKKVSFLMAFRLLGTRTVYLTLIPASLCYALWLMMLTTLSHSLSKEYGYSLQSVAIAYIPSGFGGLLGSISVGELLDYSFRVNYRRSHIRGTRFSVLKSRLIVSALPSLLCVSTSLLFAWSLQKHGSAALAVIASCVISFGAMMWLTISSTVVVDMNPTEASGSCASVNLTRCWCAAFFVGILTKMEEMGVGWCYTLMAILCGASSLCVVWLYVHESGEDLFGGKLNQ